MVLNGWKTCTNLMFQIWESNHQHLYNVAISTTKLLSQLHDIANKSDNGTTTTSSRVTSMLKFIIIHWNPSIETDQHLTQTFDHKVVKQLWASGSKMKTVANLSYYKLPSLQHGWKRNSKEVTSTNDHQTYLYNS